MRLHDQGNDVHVAYQTSGNIAVTDEFVTRLLTLRSAFSRCLIWITRKAGKYWQKYTKFLSGKQLNQIDTAEIRAIKD